MKITLNGNILSIAGADQTQYSTITSWNLTKWNKQTKSLTGIASLELLEKLSSITTLPTSDGIAEYYQKLRKAREAVDRERLTENPLPIYKPPVKTPLYKHQIRGYNMALLTFGWAEPQEGTDKHG